MSNALRKLERGIIKSAIEKDGRSVKKNFYYIWRRYKSYKENR